MNIYNLEKIAKHFKVHTDTKALNIGGKNAGDQLFGFGTKTGKGMYDNNRMNTEYLRPRAGARPTRSIGKNGLRPS